MVLKPKKNPVDLESNCITKKAGILRNTLTWQLDNMLYRLPHQYGNLITPHFHKSLPDSLTLLSQQGLPRFITIGRKTLDAKHLAAKLLASKIQDM